MKLNKVVITGVGAISPFGIGVESLYQGFLENRSAIINMGNEWKDAIPDMLCQVGGPIKVDLNEKRIPRDLRKNMGRTSILAVLSAEEAVKMAGLTQENFLSGDYGVAFSSTTGSTHSIYEFAYKLRQEKSLSSIKSGQFFQIMSHTTAANIACYFNLKGRIISPNSACASSGQSIGLAYEAIKYGLQKGMICGGAEELHVTTTATFDLLQAASFHYNDNPSETPRPFDRDRDGTVCGEGSGALVLESEESALERGAKIYGEILGFVTFSSGEHMTRVLEEDMLAGMNRLFKESNISPEEIDYVNAHGTGTLFGDVEESKAIEIFFKEKGLSPYVSSLKGHIGHTLGASAALEVIMCLKMMEMNYLIPTRNLKNPDEKCGKNNYLMDFKKKNCNLIMKNSFAFGGVNSILLLRRYNYEHK
ncbi:MAG: beta-ketoacyl-[acyl-carrier-protein] synthase family protein [Brevinematales bacterium]